MNEQKIPVREIIFLTVGEIVTSIIISLVYLLINKFNYTVALGAILGSFVTVLNFVILSVTVNRALDKIIGCDEFSKLQKKEASENKDNSNNLTNEKADEEIAESKEDDEIAKFAQQNTPKLQNAIRISFLIRIFSILAVILLAAFTKQFDIIATVIPLLMFRPILTLSGLASGKEKK